MKDFIPIQKREKIRKKRNVMEDLLVRDILDRVQKERKKNFNKELEEGKKLTFLEIRRLNTILKREYVNHIMEEDDNVRDYIQDKEAQILEKHDNVNAFLYDLEDQQVEWTQAVQRIDDRVIKRAIEIGMTGENYKKFDFEEFEIKDMYATKNGEVCWNCRKGLNCDKHFLQKKVDHLGQKDFDKMYI